MQGGEDLDFESTNLELQMMFEKQNFEQEQHSINLLNNRNQYYVFSNFNMVR